MLGRWRNNKKLQDSVQEQHTKNVVLYILIPVVLLVGVFIGTAVGAKARRDIDREKEEGSDV
jgi:hypothetical protein